MFCRLFGEPFFTPLPASIIILLYPPVFFASFSVSLLLSAVSEYAGNYFHSTSKILASPGAGSISRSLTQRLQTPTTLIPTSVVTEPAFPRHTSSPTDDIDRIVDDDAKVRLPQTSLVYVRFGCCVTLCVFGVR